MPKQESPDGQRQPERLRIRAMDISRDEHKGKGEEEFEGQGDWGVRVRGEGERERRGEGKYGEEEKELKLSFADIAISTVHARIVQEASGEFYIFDGSIAKSSTNGVWVRLSPPSKASPWVSLEPGMELLVSSIRFIVERGDDTIYEKEVMVPL